MNKISRQTSISIGLLISFISFTGLYGIAAPGESSGYFLSAKQINQIANTTLNTPNLKYVSENPQDTNSSTQSYSKLRKVNPDIRNCMYIDPYDFKAVAPEPLKYKEVFTKSATSTIKKAFSTNQYLITYSNPAAAKTAFAAYQEKFNNCLDKVIANDKKYHHPVKAVSNYEVSTKNNSIHWISRVDQHGRLYNSLKLTSNLVIATSLSAPLEEFYPENDTLLKVATTINQAQSR